MDFRKFFSEENISKVHSPTTSESSPVVDNFPRKTTKARRREHISDVFKFFVRF